MNMFDEARAIEGLRGMKKMTQSEIAKMMGTSQSYVANKLRLLSLSPRMQEKILELGLTERHARALLRIKNEDEQLKFAEKIAKMRLPVAASEALIDAEIWKARASDFSADSRGGSLMTFEKILSDSLLYLRSVGIEIDLKTSFYGRKKYITLCYEE